MVDNFSIILNTRKHHAVDWATEKALMERGVTLPGNGDGTGSIEIKGFKFPHLKHIVDIQINKDGKLDWEPEYFEWSENGAPNYTPYLFIEDWMDEPKTIEQFTRCQKIIDAVDVLELNLKPVISLPLFRETEQLYPPGGYMLTGEFVYMLDLHVIALAEAVAAKDGLASWTWREELGIPPDAEVWGYLAKYDEFEDDPWSPEWFRVTLAQKGITPFERLFPPTFERLEQAALIAPWCVAHGLSAFYYYAADHLGDANGFNEIGEALVKGAESV